MADTKKLQTQPENAERIVFSAIRLFARKGYAATTVRDIVQDAQVTNPMLYYYFGSKQGLFEHAMDQIMANRQENVAAIVESASQFRDKIRAVTALHFEILRENPFVLEFVYSVIFGPKESRPDYDVYARNQEVVELVEALIIQGVRDGEFVPRNGTPFSIAERLMSVIGTELMRGLKCYERLDAREAQDFLMDFLSETAIEDLVDFLLGGAGAAR